MKSGGETQRMSGRLDLIRRGSEKVWREVSSRYPRLTALRALAARTRGTTKGGGADPAKMVWIFGTGRSGSTWLSSMMGEVSGHLVWEEPMVGRLFGTFYDKTQKANLRRAAFIMGDPTRDGWLRSIRNFVLDGAQYAHPMLGSRHHLVVKEPNGSLGAPLIMEALPESRMILLVRDPRDVAASALDATKKGGWLHDWADKGRWKEDAVADNNPNALVRSRSNKYLAQVGAARRAYEAHGGPKVLVRYEDLRADAVEAMKRIYRELGIPVDEKEVRRAVEKHAWENIPEDKKGEGKFYRKGKSGGWREDLTPEQVEIVEKTTAPLLEKFYA
jgi:hypothetical protein